MVDWTKPGEYKKSKVDKIGGIISGNKIVEDVQTKKEGN